MTASGGARAGTSPTRSTARCARSTTATATAAVGCPATTSRPRRPTSTPQRISITAGTLDPPTGLRTSTALFCAEASDYHVLPAGLDRREYE